jgi:hypothetical protein
VGRPEMRVIAARLSFFIFRCRLLDITAPFAVCVALFSDKYLKKWYQLPASGSIAGRNCSGFWLLGACLGGVVTDSRASKAVLRHTIGDARTRAMQKSCPLHESFPRRAEIAYTCREISQFRTKCCQ